MNRLILFFLICISQVWGKYFDPEIEALLRSLSNPSNPTLEDYHLIESYFQFGERPYFKNMTKRADLNYRIKQLRNFKLVGPNGEMPITELYASNVREGTKDRCILIYGSYNRDYPEKARRLFEALKVCGYSGYIMLRIGGIPDISHGGARLCTIPWTWRINFFKEAVRRGFKQILYIDASYHPLNDLSEIFDVVDNYGLFSYTVDIDWIENMYNDYIQHLGIPVEQMHQIPWFDPHILGLNFTNEKINQLFQKWDEEMHQEIGFCTIGDDVPFTCIAWLLGFRPYFYWDEVIGPSKLFYKVPNN
jgi:hypothetical protein